MAKETPGITSDGVCWKPSQLSFKYTKQFPEIFFPLRAGAKNNKNNYFSVWVKPKMAENVMGQNRKNYYIKLAQNFVVLQRR